MAALGRTPLTPNQVTVVGLGLTFLAAGLAAFGQLRWAGVVLIFAGTCDILDGALARSTRASYPYGAFLDSTLNRYSEGAVYLGLAAYFVTIDPPLQAWPVLPPTRRLDRSVRRRRRPRPSAGPAASADQFGPPRPRLLVRRRVRPGQVRHRACARLSPASRGSSEAKSRLLGGRPDQATIDQ